MKTIVFAFLIGMSGAQVHASVAWGTSTQNLIYCYPVDQNGKFFPNSYPVADRYCLQIYGANWGYGKDGVVRCYPRSTAKMRAPRFPIDASWCAQ